MNFEMLVNKSFPLDKNYIPENLVKVESIGEHLDDGHIVMLVKEVYEAFLKLQKDAPFEIIVDSGYRDYNYQKELLEHYLNEQGEAAYLKVALPGTSEHQTGLAVDYAYIIDGKYDDDVEKYPEYNKWVHENAHKYGFILRYPLNKTEITGFNYEPWHLRYIGKNAKYIYENNLTLEEYIEKNSK